MEKAFTITEDFEKQRIVVDFKEGTELTQGDVIMAIGDAMALESYTEFDVLANLHHCTVEDDFLDKNVVEEIVKTLNDNPKVLERRSKARTALVANERVTRELSDLYAILSRGRANRIKSFEREELAVAWLDNTSD